MNTRKLILPLLIAAALAAPAAFAQNANQAADAKKPVASADQAAEKASQAQTPTAADAAKAKAEAEKKAKKKAKDSAVELEEEDDK